MTNTRRAPRPGRTPSRFGRRRRARARRATRSKSPRQSPRAPWGILQSTACPETLPNARQASGRSSTWYSTSRSRGEQLSSPRRAHPAGRCPRQQVADADGLPSFMKSCLPARPNARWRHTLTHQFYRGACLGCSAFELRVSFLPLALAQTGVHAREPGDKGQGPVETTYFTSAQREREKERDAMEAETSCTALPSWPLSRPSCRQVMPSKLPSCDVLLIRPCRIYMRQH